jgi:hypothetical protein
MAVVLVLIVVAVGLAVYLSATRGGFGPVLKLSLLIPAITIFVSIVIIYSHVLAFRSPWVANLGLVVLAMTLVELPAFVTAIMRLIHVATLRTRRNFLIAALGGISVAPAIAICLIVLIRDRYAG